MTRRTQENIVSVLLLAVFVGVIWLCQDFGPRARLIPLPLAIFGIVLTLVQIVWQNVGSTDELQMDMITVGKPAAVMALEPEAETPAPKAKRVTWAHELGALGIVGALLGLILTLGLFPAVFLFTAGYFLISRQYSWLQSMIYTSILTVSVYLLFAVALQMQPYHGLLAPLVERFT